MLSVIFWDPSPAALPWNIPFLERPILWYGVFFAVGFLLAYFFLVYLLKSYLNQDSKLKKEEKKKRAIAIAEKALVYSVIGTIVGARLGDFLFYQGWQEIISNPLALIQVWKGGLASHGGAVGVLIAFWFFYKKIKKLMPKPSFLKILDIVCIPVAMVGGFIRMGNFFNQEILGTCTNLPWAVVFGHPADGGFPCPRHPVQLYESVFYFLTASVLYLIWRKDKLLERQGRIFSLFLVMVFGFRFLVESVKLEQSEILESSYLTMGQWLSIPFILTGAFMLWKGKKAS